MRTCNGKVGDGGLSALPAERSVSIARRGHMCHVHVRGAVSASIIKNAFRTAETEARVRSGCVGTRCVRNGRRARWDAREPAMKELRSCRARGGDSGPGTGATGPGELAAEIAPLTLSRDLDGAMGESSCEVMDWRRMCGCVRDRELMCDMVGEGRRGARRLIFSCCGLLPLRALASFGGCVSSAPT